MNGFTPNNNTNVIQLLSEAIRKFNKGRNRILMGAVILCILTLTFVFGTAYVKINADGKTITSKRFKHALITPATIKKKSGRFVSPTALKIAAP